jgi:sulfur carrier protein ThiS
VRVHLHIFGPLEFYTQGLSPGLVSGLPWVELAEGATVEDLLKLLRLSGTAGVVRPFVSVNGLYRREDLALCDGDRVELRPPMTGG